MIAANDRADELNRIRARARLVLLALMGAEKSGASLDGGVYADALRQGVYDVVEGLDALAGAEPRGAAGKSS